MKNEPGIGLHKIVENLRGPMLANFYGANKLFAALCQDILDHTNQFQRFFAGDIDWMYSPSHKLTWDHVTSPIGVLAPRTYIEWETELTINDHPEVPSVHTRQGLFMWGPDFFEEPFVKKYGHGLKPRYLSIEFTKRHPLGDPDMIWIPDPAFVLCLQDCETYELSAMIQVLPTPELSAAKVAYLAECYQSDAARSGFIYSKFLEAMKCSNVGLQDNPAPRQLNKKRLSRGVTPLFSYKTLHIKGSASKSSNGHHGGSHSSPRLHFRRGHVRRLSSEKTVWVSSCMVGNEQRGKVTKNYVIDKPGAPEAV